MLRTAIATAVLVGCGFNPTTIDGTAGGGEPIGSEPPMPDAAIAIVGGQMATSTAGGSHMSDSATLTSTLTAGDLIVVAVSWGGGMTTAQCADSAGNAFQQLTAVTAHDGVGHTVFYAEGIRGATADTVTVTLGANQSNVALRVIEYSGIAASNALDQHAVTTGMGSTATSAPVTTTHAHELIYAASTNTGNANAAGQDYMLRVIYAGDICEDREVMTIGTYTATIDEGSSEQWTMTIATFRAAS